MYDPRLIAADRWRRPHVAGISWVRWRTISGFGCQLGHYNPKIWHQHWLHLLPLCGHLAFSRWTGKEGVGVDQWSWLCQLCRKWDGQEYAQCLYRIHSFAAVVGLNGQPTICWQLVLRGSLIILGVWFAPGCSSAPLVLGTWPVPGSPFVPLVLVVWFVPGCSLVLLAFIAWLLPLIIGCCFVLLVLGCSWNIYVSTQKLLPSGDRHPGPVLYCTGVLASGWYWSWAVRFHGSRPRFSRPACRTGAVPLL